MMSVSKGYLTWQCWEDYETKNQILREQIIPISTRRCRKFKTKEPNDIFF